MSALFEETTLNGMQLKNRLVRSATHEAMADDNGFPTDALFRLYERLAKGGVGLIITGHTYVSRDGKTNAMLGMDADEHIPRYRALVDHVHRWGAKIVMQINHCGRQTTQEMTGSPPLAPSAVKETAMFVMPQAMTEDDIQRTIAAFVQAARRAKQSGFDGVQLHGAHGYLINQFLCPHTNRRKDQWGGSLTNRIRFVQKIYAGVREAVGKRYPVLIKLNAYDHMKNGLKPEEGVAIAEKIAQMGFDGIEVSCGIGEDGGSTLRGDLPLDVVLDEWPMYRNKNVVFRFMMRHFGKLILKPIPFTQGFNRESAAKIKRRVDVPVFAVGGMTDPAFMEETLRSGAADYISLSRALITEPDFPNKIKEGRREPSRCVHCNLCLFYLGTRSLRCYRGKKLRTGHT